MFALELVNSGIERVVDLVTEEYHPFAKQAKDLAAGAVFIYAVVSVVIGIVIFLPYILKMFAD
jgi:undecaprenol kinase